jgi:hypothetical protein
VSTTENSCQTPNEQPLPDHTDPHQQKLTQLNEQSTPDPRQQSNNQSPLTSHQQPNEQPLPNTRQQPNEKPPLDSHLQSQKGSNLQKPKEQNEKEINTQPQIRARNIKPMEAGNDQNNNSAVTSLIHRLENSMIKLFEKIKEDGQQKEIITCEAKIHAEKANARRWKAEHDRLITEHQLHIQQIQDKGHTECNAKLKEAMDKLHQQEHDFNITVFTQGIAMAKRKGGHVR